MRVIDFRNQKRLFAVAGVLLLRKVPQSVSDEDIQRILRSVPMETTAVEDPFLGDVVTGFGIMHAHWM